MEQPDLNLDPRCPACGIHASEHRDGVAPGELELGLDVIADCRGLAPMLIMPIGDGRPRPADNDGEADA